MQAALRAEIQSAQPVRIGISVALVPDYLPGLETQLDKFRQRIFVIAFSGLALSVKACRLCQIPPFVAARHLPPARGKSFLKGRAFGSPRKLHLLAKASPFGRGGFAKQRRRGRGCYPLCSFKKRNTGTPAGVPVLQSLNKEDHIRLRASSSALSPRRCPQAFCSCTRTSFWWAMKRL